MNLKLTIRCPSEAERVRMEGNCFLWGSSVSIKCTFYSSSLTSFHMIGVFLQGYKDVSCHVHMVTECKQCCEIVSFLSVFVNVRGGDGRMWKDKVRSA